MFDFIVIFSHLFTAIIFIGYVFFDAIFLSNIKNNLEIKKAYFKSSGIIYAISFLILIVSGIILAFKEFEFVNKIAFILKISLIIFMFLITILSIYYVKFKNNREYFLVKHSHLIALVLCFLIVLLAKLLLM